MLGFTAWTFKLDNVFLPDLARLYLLSDFLELSHSIFISAFYAIVSRVALRRRDCISKVLLERVEFSTIWTLLIFNNVFFTMELEIVSHDMGHFMIAKLVPLGSLLASAPDHGLVDLFRR